MATVSPGPVETPAVAPAMSFRLQVAARLRALPWLKAFGITGFMTAFFVVYFHLLNAPAFAVTVMPFTALDRAVSFQPWTLGVYLSLWCYVSLTPALFDDRRELLAYGVVAAGVAAGGFAVFYFFPTVIAAPSDIDWAEHPAFTALKEVDRSGNAFPSLHVAFAVFSARWFARLLPALGDRGFWRGLSWLWCAAIAYSTVATRQHVLLDVAGGAVLGWAGGGVRLQPIVNAFAKVRARAAE